MVKIENIDELSRITQTNYGYVVIVEAQEQAVMHKPSCKLLTNENFFQSKKTEKKTRFHWFSSYSIAEKEFSNLVACKNCNP